MPGSPSGTSSPDSKSRGRSAADPGRTGSSRIDAVDLPGWLETHGPRLVEDWIHELRARDLGFGAEAVVETFARRIVAMMPEMIGPYRHQIEPLWDRAAQLYGAIAAKRGLAAGEAIDELNILRELVIRQLYRDPPCDPSLPVALREFLRLNRSVDRAVSHASVGHTDALFFQFFEDEGSRTPLLRGDDLEAEALGQLAEIRSEVDEILRQAPWNGERAGVRGN